MTVNTTVLTTAHAAVVGSIPPRSHGPGASSCTWVNMSTFAAIQAVVSTGLLSVGATVSAKLEQAKDAAGTGAKDITGKAITPLTEAGDDDNVQAAINCRAADLDVNGGFTHARLTVTSAGADANTTALVFGFAPRYGTAADNKAASLVEIVP
ncbi:hypothetical protein VY88_26985 [Azospirillum thiophilum]|uniref:Uncharacterized protein n=1 Tax=Azospirillum thiophilum TaxID=528244 RepID=A0AAC8W584_9PROT|nr:hypothetical protein [Azospirillum thiophilum]ALG75155.1 hypothetical protein AL072_29890 [Azospirillum thiophilum]KJR62549.1 hypothetical protein VY88_26985 [Azospirillum thiophilum]